MISVEEFIERQSTRKSGFSLMAHYLRGIDNPVIVETGLCRSEDNFSGDGMSTLLWDAIAKEKNGEVYGIDIDDIACNITRRKVSDKTKVYCDDSVARLAEMESQFKTIGKKVNLLYLDSFDLDLRNPLPSSIHHLKELLSIKSVLADGCLVAVDDNLVYNNEKIGKGRLVKEWMRAANKQMLSDGYQHIWRW